MRVVQAFTRETTTRRTSATVTERYRDSNMETVVLNGLYFPFVDLLSTSVARGRAAGYGGHLYFQRETSRSARSSRSCSTVQNLLRPGSAAVAALQHVPVRQRRRSTDHGRARRGAGGAADPREHRPAARSRQATCGSRDVRFGYSKRRRRVLHGLDLDVPRRNDGRTRQATPAQGRSTIAKLLARFYGPTEGQHHDRRHTISAT